MNNEYNTMLENFLPVIDKAIEEISYKYRHSIVIQLYSDKYKDDNRIKLIIFDKEESVVHNSLPESMIYDEIVFNFNDDSNNCVIMLKHFYEVLYNRIGISCPIDTDNLYNWCIIKGVNEPLRLGGHWRKVNA